MTFLSLLLYILFEAFKIIFPVFVNLIEFVNKFITIYLILYGSETIISFKSFGKINFVSIFLLYALNFINDIHSSNNYLRLNSSNETKMLLSFVSKMSKTSQI